MAKFIKFKMCECDLLTRDFIGLQSFGYISGMDIKILSSYQSEILEVIGKSPSLL